MKKIVTPLFLLVWISLMVFTQVHPVSASTTPSWWSGNCNVNNHAGSYALGASFNGVAACGGSNSGTPINYFTGSVGEYEWQCVELSMRYMYLVYGIKPYLLSWPGYAKTIVSDYPGNQLEKKTNNGTSIPSPGDILAFDGDVNNPAGHTAVVTATSVNTSGNGTITIMEQNSAWTSNGSRNITVSNSIVGDGTPGKNITGWLHANSNNLSASHLRQFYVLDNNWVAADISAQSGVNIVGNPSQNSSGGIFARDTNNRLRQFYVGSNGWTAFDVSYATRNPTTGDTFIASDVAASAAGILARDTNNHLRQFYVNNGWQAADISAQSGVNIVGNPYISDNGDIFARDTNNHLRQFYVGPNGWTTADVSDKTHVNIAGDPSVSEGGVWARDADNHLRQFYVVNGDWVAADISIPSGVFINTNAAPGPGGTLAG